MKKVVVITGASSGIGLELAKLYIKNDYIVYGISRKSIFLEGLNYITCDISLPQECKRAINQIIEKHNNIDILINNAGMGISGSIENTDPERVEQIFNVNFLGLFSITKYSLPFIRRAKGRIVNISSVAGSLPIPFQSFYSATKSAVISFSSALRAEVKPYKVKVLTVLPGDTKSNFTANRIKNSEEGVYTQRVKNSLSVMEKDELNGTDTYKVAYKIYKNSIKRCPKNEMTVGFSYKLILFLNKILPKRFVEFVIYKIYAKK